MGLLYKKSAVFTISNTQKGMYRDKKKLKFGMTEKKGKLKLMGQWQGKPRLNIFSPLLCPIKSARCPLTCYPCFLTLPLFGSEDCWGNPLDLAAWEAA
jgi:hypothetical protein